VRIRPKAKEGGHLATEQVGYKKLEGWSEEEVMIGDVRSGKLQKYTYPIKVIGPEKSQQETYDGLMPDMVDAFLDGYNAMYFAYGQTGTGKTHTMFGEAASLKHFTETGEIHE